MCHPERSEGSERHELEVCCNPLYLLSTFFLLANHKELKEDTKATMDLCVR